MAEEEDGGLNLDVIMATVILIIYTVAAPIFNKIHFHYMHESGLCMIIGVIISVVASILRPGPNFEQSLSFSEEIFFVFVLPPIIFSAGYNLRRASFFKYFIYILTFGVLGTISSFLFVAPITMIFNKFDQFYIPASYAEGKDINNQTDIYRVYDKEGNIIEQQSNIEEVLERGVNEGYKPFFNSSNAKILFPMINSSAELNLNKKLESALNNFTDKQQVDTSDGPLLPMSNPNETLPEPEVRNEYIIIHFTVPEILLFASVIAATDTIAALTFISEKKEPKLFAILFGEGVVNDAVCIVLYRILREFTTSGQEFTAGTPMLMFQKFLSVSIFSFFIGLIMGCLCAWLLKFFLRKGIILDRTQEVSILLFFSFLSYNLAEVLGLSPIVCLLFCGLFMSNYAFYNLSFQGREESSVVSRMISNIAEAFVFVYLGLTLLSYIRQCFCFSFIIIELIIVVCGRFFAIFGIAWLFKFLGVKSFKMKTSQKGIMGCSGSIRGAIAFGLAISIQTNNRLHKEVIISSTLILVFFTTIVLGAMMPFMINLMKKLDPPEENDCLEKVETNPDDLLKCVHFNFVHPNFSEMYDWHKEKNIEVLKTRISYYLGNFWLEFDEMIIKPWLCYQWPWTFQDNINVKNVILKSVKKYEEEQKNVKHFIRGETPIEEMKYCDNKENLISNLEDNNEEHETEDENIKNDEEMMEKSSTKKDKKFVELSTLSEGK